MMDFVVFTADLPLAPLIGENTRGGELHEFQKIEEAREFSKSQKENWDRVILYKRIESGKLDRIEHYQNGNYYIGDKRVRNS
ncbi:hypothetical protein DSCW_08410 [Desulfosarcina widdelii]|uniref:Uncharacterized protein n=1 Tax=Desulfosarcina widdelii TaxID=947919 RepID=A0A5K7Z4P0_9BACT|nr:hypothetical protein [Desulfosarcina widdelii]BBO73424.1 hypothetical protein DSCW_08410 [Desulfosarcina widdelii]